MKNGPCQAGTAQIHPNPIVPGLRRVVPGPGGPKARVWLCRAGRAWPSCAGPNGLLHLKKKKIEIKSREAFNGQAIPLITNFIGSQRLFLQAVHMVWSICINIMCHQLYNLQVFYQKNNFIYGSEIETCTMQLKKKQRWDPVSMSVIDTKRFVVNLIFCILQRVPTMALRPNMARARPVFIFCRESHYPTIYLPLGSRACIPWASENSHGFQ